jgi:hypothetical protein
VLIGELESLDDSKRFLDGSTNGEIVNVGCPEDTLGVNEEGSSERDTLLLKVNTVSLRDGVRSVGVLNVSGSLEFASNTCTDHSQLEIRTETTLLPVHLGPSEVGELAVSTVIEDYLV